MGEIPHASALERYDVALLAFVQHMVETARTEAGRRMFREYAELERERFVAGDGRLPGVADGGPAPLQ